MGTIASMSVRLSRKSQGSKPAVSRERSATGREWVSRHAVSDTSTAISKPQIAEGSRSVAGVSGATQVSGASRYIEIGPLYSPKASKNSGNEAPCSSTPWWATAQAL